MDQRKHQHRHVEQDRYGVQQPTQDVDPHRLYLELARPPTRVINGAAAEIEGDEALPRNPIGASLSSPALLLHVDPSEVLEPTLRADKALHMLAHGPRVQIVNDEQPRRIVDNDLVCLADVGGDLIWIG
jgi:hypothetical protein